MFAHSPTSFIAKTSLVHFSEDHLFFQDQDQSGQDQDHFFKTKTAFFKDHQIINTRPLA